MQKNSHMNLVAPIFAFFFSVVNFYFLSASELVFLNEATCYQKLAEFGVTEADLQQQFFELTQIKSLLHTQALEQAYEAHPNDPLMRAEVIRTQLQNSVNTPPHKVLAINSKNQAHYLKHAFPHVTIESNPELNTLEASGQQGITAETDVVILGLHGLSNCQGHVGAFLQQITLFELINSLIKDSKYKITHLDKHKKEFIQEVFTRLRENNLLRNIHFRAIDLPGHGAGPKPQQEQALNQGFDILKAWIAQTQEAITATGKDIPILLLGRSASPNLVAELVSQHPELAMGVIYMSQTHPDLSLGFTDSFKAVIQESENQLGVLNLYGLEWLLNFQPEIRYHQQDPPFAPIPTYMITGSDDDQTSELSRGWYKTLAEQHPLITYHNYDHRHHDVLRYPVPTNTLGTTYHEWGRRGAGLNSPKTKVPLTFYSSYATGSKKTVNHPSGMKISHDEDREISFQVYDDLYLWLNKNY